MAEKKTLEINVAHDRVVKPNIKRNSMLVFAQYKYLEGKKIKARIVY
jgi:hypothetical protein